MISEEKQQLLTEGFFARHETFCPRYGWLKKGVDGVSHDERIFDRSDAIELLGVGKNMVRSIRFWCLAFKLITQKEDGKKAGGPMVTTEFAEKLLSDDGWDPYLEDPASLWLLHWRLFSPPLVAPAWSMAMNLTGIRYLSGKELTHYILEYQSYIPSFQRFSESSFEKDASCFLRMYSPPSNRISDEIECPFTQLGLLSHGEKKGSFQFNTGEKMRLPDLILLAACLDYAGKYHPTSSTLSLNAISYGFNSPGVIFKLSETDIGNSLEKVVADIYGLSFVESYGNRQLLMEASPAGLYREALAKYYRNTHRMGL